MTSDAKLGLAAGVLAVIGVAVFGLPKNEKTATTTALPQRVEPVTPPPAAVTANPSQH